MKKICIVFCFISFGVLLAGCAKKEKKIRDVMIVRDEPTQVVEDSKTITVEPTVKLTDTPQNKVTPTSKPSMTPQVTPSSEESPSSIDDEAIPDDTGDVDLNYGDTQKFVNMNNFINAVPSEVLSKFNSSVPEDILKVYPDITFVAYDESTENIYAKTDEYYISFISLGKEYSMCAELKEYANWWIYD